MTFWMPRFLTLVGSVNSVQRAEACRLIPARTVDIERESVRAVLTFYKNGTSTPHYQPRITMVKIDG